MQFVVVGTHTHTHTLNKVMPSRMGIVRLQMW